MALTLEPQTVLDAIPEIAWITDQDLRETVVKIWITAFADSPWNSMEDVPKNPELPLHRTLLAHTRSVVRIARSMAETVEEVHGVDVDRDVLVAAAILHDVSKVREFEVVDGKPGKSRIGRLYQHGFLGAHWLEEADVDAELVHAVLVHTPVSNVIPQTTEAVIVYYADFVDTDVQHLDAGVPLFCKRK